MGRTRTTFSVVEFKNHVNTVLANSAPDWQQARVAVALTLEHVLMETGNYRGFQFLESEYLPADQRTPGGNVLRPNYDGSRRRYN